MSNLFSSGQTEFKALVLNSLDCNSFVTLLNLPIYTDVMLALTAYDAC